MKPKLGFKTSKLYFKKNVLSVKLSGLSTKPSGLSTKSNCPGVKLLSGDFKKSSFSFER